MNHFVLYFPKREEMTTMLTATLFLLKKQGIGERPMCTATLDKLQSYLEKQSELYMLACDVTAEGILPVLEQLRQYNPDMKLVLLADGTVTPVQYIRPTILPTALLWRPVRRDEAKQVIGEVLVGLPNENTDKDCDDSFSVEVRGVVRMFPYREILFFEAREKRLYLHLRRKEIPFPGTLERLLDSLPEQFLRIHKSVIVNRNRITEIQFGQNQLVLEGGTIVPISRSYKAQVKAVFS